MNHDGQLTALIFNVMRFAVHDGPGIRTTVFFKGCPLACQWCHNPESQGYRPDVLYSEERCARCGDCAAACPEHAIERVNGVMSTSNLCRRCGVCLDYCQTEARQIAGRRVTLDELIAEIEKDLVFFDESGGGVTLSGGEPLSQPRFVSALLGVCRDRRIDTVLETCGFAPPFTFDRIASRAGRVLFDLKIVDDDRHRRYTGVSNRWILQNLETLAGSGHPLTVRIPVIPGINDSDTDLRQFSQLLSGLGIERVELLPYHRIGTDKYRKLGWTYPLDSVGEPTPADLHRFAGVLEQAGVHAGIGG